MKTIMKLIAMSLIVIQMISLYGTIIVTAKEQDAISIKDFGANGNDDQDDGYGIQAAIDYAADQGIGTIIIPEGEYVIETTLNLYSNMNLVGTKGAILKLKDGLDANTILLSLKESENITIKEIVFDGNVDGLNIVDTPFNSEALINQNNSSKETINVTIEDCTIQNTYTRGIRLKHAYNVIIQDNTFDNVGFDNISIMEESKGVDILNNDFRDGKSVAIKAYNRVSDMTVSQNTIKDFGFATGDEANNWSIGIEFTQSISDITCVGNTVENVGDIGISISKVDGGLVSDNTILNVANGQNNGLGIELFSANEVDVSGNTIKYSSIKNTILSRSTNCSVVNNYLELVLDNEGNDNTQHIELSSSDEITTENCVIEGNQLIGGTRGILGAKAKDITIEANQFNNNFIAIDYGYYGEGENIKILNNDFEDFYDIMRQKNMTNLTFYGNNVEY